MGATAHEELPLAVNVEVELLGPGGEVKQREEIHNLIPTAGKEAIAKLLKEGTVRPTHMGIGKKNTEAKAADTELAEELDRNAVTSEVTGKVWSGVAEWAAGDGTGAIVEAGLFSAAAAGTLFARAVFSVINKGAEDTLKITWKITVE